MWSKQETSGFNMQSVECSFEHKLQKQFQALHVIIHTVKEYHSALLVIAKQWNGIQIMAAQQRIKISSDLQISYFQCQWFCLISYSAMMNIM